MGLNLNILKTAKKVNKPVEESNAFTEPKVVTQQPVIEERVVEEPQPKPIIEEVIQQPQPQPIVEEVVNQPQPNVTQNINVPEGMMLVGYYADMKPRFAPDPNYRPKPKIVGYDLNMNPIYEDDAPENNLKPLSLIEEPLTQDELKQHVVTALGLPAGSDITVYEVPYAHVQPKTLEITDTNGLLKEKVERAERKTGLSVIPLKVAGLNNFVTSIQDYYVYAVDGVKFATSLDHRVNTTRFDELCEKIDEAIMNGGCYNESIMMEYTDAYGEKYTVPSLNKFEMGYLAALYKNYRAVFYEEDGNISVAVGV